MARLFKLFNFGADFVFQFWIALKEPGAVRFVNTVEVEVVVVFVPVNVDKSKVNNVGVVAVVRRKFTLNFNVVCFKIRFKALGNDVLFDARSIDNVDDVRRFSFSGVSAVVAKTIPVSSEWQVVAVEVA